MSKQKVDWRDLDDEEKNFEARVEIVEKTVKKEERDLKTGKLKQIEELVQVHKRVFPVTKAVKQRKLMKKFGDCKDLLPGTSKQGELQLDLTIRLENEDKKDRFEIDIVTRIKGLNQDEIKQKKQEERLRKQMIEQYGELEQNVEQEQIVKGGGTDKLSEWASKAKVEYNLNQPIKIENILLDQGEEEDELKQEEQFKEFITTFINKFQTKQNILEKVKFNIKILRYRGQDFKMGRAFLFVNDPNHASKLYEALNELRYGNCVLDISWAEARKEQPRGGEQDKRDNRRR